MVDNFESIIKVKEVEVMKKKKPQIDFNLDEFEDMEAEREYKIKENEQQKPGKIFFWCCWTLAIIICIFTIHYFIL